MHFRDIDLAIAPLLCMQYFTCEAGPRLTKTVTLPVGAGPLEATASPKTVSGCAGTGGLGVKSIVMVTCSDMCTCTLPARDLC